MVFEKIAALLANTVHCDASEIHPDTNFEDLGIDSLDIAEVVMKIEDEYGISLEMDGSLAQVSDLVSKIEEKISEK